MLDTKTIIKDFPILSQMVNSVPLHYLDNAATTQKPKSVMDAISTYYSQANANVHRGSHTLSDRATSLYEKSRETVSGFIGAKSDELIFTKNTTEGINIISYSYALNTLKTGDEILLGIWEHHSNLVPWQEVCKKTGARLSFMQLDANGCLDFEDFRKKLNSKTKILAIGHASNVLGTIFPVSEMAYEASKYGAFVVVDAAQSAPNIEINTSSLGVDALAFSGHKMLGPMGIGALWVSARVREKLSPFLTGGGMIKEVGLDLSTWEDFPLSFEAGTPNVEGAVGLSEAISYIQALGMKNIRSHEVELGEYVLSGFSKLRQDNERLHLIGPENPKLKTGILSFWLDGVHAHDISAVLDQHGIAIRSGYHCAMPLHKKLGIGPSVRASWYVYNTTEDIDALISGVKEAIKILCY